MLLAIQRCPGWGQELLEVGVGGHLETRSCWGFGADLLLGACTLVSPPGKGPCCSLQVGTSSSSLRVQRSPPRCCWYSAAVQGQDAVLAVPLPPGSLPPLRRPSGSAAEQSPGLTLASPLSHVASLSHRPPTCKMGMHREGGTGRWSSLSCDRSRVADGGQGAGWGHCLGPARPSGQRGAQGEGEEA